MSEIKLLRCPFCGGEAELLKGQCEIDNYVMCLECRSKTKLYNTKASAIKAWNTRKPMQNDETIEIVKSEFEDMKGHLDNVLNALLSEKETELSGIYNSQIEHMIAQDRMEYKNEIIDDVIDIIKREFLL